MRRSPAAVESNGFALVITIVTIALLTIMAVAFLSSSTLERATSRASVNKSKADLAAHAAVEGAIEQLTDSFTRFPDSATSWEAVNDTQGALQYQGTVLYYRPQTPETLNNPLSAPPTPTPALNILPLISGATVQATPDPAATSNQQARSSALRAALPTLDDTNSYNFNHARSAGDVQGWIGSSPQWVAGKPSAPQPFRGLWIDLKNSNGKSTARYAYWVEDESFKANVNLLGKTARGSASLGMNPSEIPLQGILATALGSNANLDTAASDIFDFRSKFPAAKFFEFRSLNHVTGQSTLAENSKFIGTINSGALNLSRSGSKRANLNAIVSTSTSASAIRTQLDEIISAITSQLPNFGQRFYRLGTDLNSADVPDTSTEPDRTIYLNKIAANIRDYIDTDSQPTIVNNDGDPTTTPPKPFTVRIGTAPSNALGSSGGGNSGPNEVVAIGKEPVPFLQEYALRIRLTKFSPPAYIPLDSKDPQASNPGADYEFYLDYYFEFWNMGTKDISAADLGPNPFLLVSNQFGWDAGGGQRITQTYINPVTNIPLDPKRDFKIPLNSIPNLVFKAGAPTVITTDPNNFVALVPNKQCVFVASNLEPVTGTGHTTDDFRRYAGKTFRDSTAPVSGYPSKARALRINILPRSTSQTDYETEVSLGNDQGMLESFEALPVATNISVNNDSGDRIDSQQYFFRGGSLRGNASAPPCTQTGDPRTNNEQLNVAVYDSTLATDQTRYVDSGLNNKAVPDNSSLTKLNTAPPGSYVVLSRWTDALSNPAAPYTSDSNHAPMVLANALLNSIGELGHIFDPARAKNASASNNIRYSRGGGRTLKIGQPEAIDATNNPAGLWDGDSGSASREWVAWRLTDIFAENGSVQLDGLVNLNGVSRDGGSALKAALYGYAFETPPDGDPTLSGQNLSDAAIQALLDEIQARASNDASRYNQFAKTAGPFVERGELSELPIFNQGTDMTGSNMSSVMDRGREELFRRLVELVTTRGNVFSVYAVGQSLVPAAGTATPIVTSTSQLKITFRLDPIWNAGMPADPFVPAQAATRFKKPDGYAVKILYAGD
jgi:hypothetical protein